MAVGTLVNNLIHNLTARELIKKLLEVEDLDTMVSMPLPKTADEDEEDEKMRTEIISADAETVGVRYVIIRDDEVILSSVSMED